MCNRRQREIQSIAELVPNKFVMSSRIHYDVIWVSVTFASSQTFSQSNTRQSLATKSLPNKLANIFMGTLRQRNSK